MKKELKTAGKSQILQAFTLAASLKARSDIIDTVPILMELATGEVFFGARFRLKCEIQANYLSVRRGDVKAGEVFGDMRFQLIGDYPYQGPSNSINIFRMSGTDIGDWYVDDRTLPRAPHPFWIMRRWHHEELAMRFDESQKRLNRVTFKYDALLLSSMRPDPVPPIRLHAPVEASAI